MQALKNSLEPLEMLLKCPTELNHMVSAHKTTSKIKISHAGLHLSLESGRSIAKSKGHSDTPFQLTNMSSVENPFAANVSSILGRNLMCNQISVTKVMTMFQRTKVMTMFGEKTFFRHVNRFYTSTICCEVL